MDAAPFHTLRASPADVDALLDPWLRRFCAVRERELRRTVLVEAMQNVDDCSLLALLDRIDHRAALGEADCRWLSTELALTPGALTDLPYERLVDLYALARETGVPALARRFLGTQPHTTGPAEGNPHQDLTPGERTAAARGSDRFLLDRLLFDRDPRVIAVLLDNPRLVERDAVRIAAQRPTNAAILSLLIAHRRWGHRYRVRKAVAANPAAAPALARQLLPGLLRQDLRELLESRSVVGELAEDIARLLAQSAPHPSPPGVPSPTATSPDRDP